MNDTKQWWQSKGVIGGLVALVMFALTFFEVDLDEGAVTEAVTLLVGAVGAVVGIYGRVKAEKEIE